MDKDLQVRESILEIVENQINENNPPETKLTLERLIKEGHKESEAKKLISYCLLTELNSMIKAQRLFDSNKIC